MDVDVPLKMNRAIHGAVKRDLTRVEAGLRAMATGQDPRGAVAATWANLYKQLDHHHTSEDDYLWPWLRTKGVDPTVLDALEGEHVDLMSGMDKANELVGTACRSGEPADATAAADAVAAAAQVIYGHVEHEEGFAEEVVRPLLTDPGFKPVAKGLRKSSLPDACVFFSWVKDDAESEHADFLHNLLPAPVSFMFANTFGRSYEREMAASWR